MSTLPIMLMGFLDKVKARQNAHSGTGSISSVAYSVEQHCATEDADGIMLQMTALTALQLYVDGVLSADRNHTLRIDIAGRACGTYYQHWLRTPPCQDWGNSVILRLGREPVAHEAPYDPDVWLQSLVPLKLLRQGLWDPAEEYWGEKGEPIGDWAKPHCQARSAPNV